MQKLTQDGDVKVDFYPNFCVIHDRVTSHVKAVGMAQHGLYFLVNKPIEDIVNSLKERSEKEATGRKTWEGSKVMQADSEIDMPETVNNAPKISLSTIWHWRLGHAPLQRVKKIPQLKGIKEEGEDVCITCPKAKFTKLPYNSSESKAKEVFELVHIDIWGPYRVATRHNHRFFLTIVDDHSRVTWIQLLRHKSDAYEAIEEFVNMGKNQFNKHVKVIRSDNALEFDDKKCKPFFARLGIIHQTSCVDRPEQNGRAERKHRNILEMSRALRFQSGLPLQFWGDSVMCAVHITNRLPSGVLNNQSPFEVLFKTPPTYLHLKVFGCLVMAKNPSRNKDKFAERGVPCVFLGYPQTQKGYKLLNLNTNQTFVSRDVKFHENIIPYKMFHHRTESQPHKSLIINPGIESEPPNEENNTPENPTPDCPPVNNVTEALVRRSSRQSQPPAWHKDYVTGKPTTTNPPLPITQTINTTPTANFSCFLSHTLHSHEPTHFKEAIKHTAWVNAMNEELDALEENNTWHITDLPPGKTAIGCKWLYKIKHNADGTVSRYKSRLVILGNKQRYGVDYEHTFAPVAKMATVRSLLAVASLKGWCLHQMDVKNAFLHGDLQEHVYMKLPPGYKGQGHRLEVNEEGEFCKPSGNKKVCKLNKSLYGLKQAPRQWFAKLSCALKSHQFIQSKSDYSLFTKKSGDSITVILVYVDDLILAGNDSEAINSAKAFLHKSFHMKDMGSLRYFLGIEVDQCKEGIFISQRKYIQDILKEYKMVNCRPLKLPMDSHVKMTPESGSPLPCAEIYQRLVGKLIYLTLTRPDLAFTIHVLSKFMHHPTDVHLQAAKRVLRYLAGSYKQGILLANQSSAQLQAYCDSDWAGCASTRRSTSGYCILLGVSPISWKAKRQSVVSRSSAEAEYRSMALAICEVMWLKQLLRDLDMKDMEKTPLYCDNQAALAIAANPVHHEKTKHVDIDCHFIRDKTQDGVVSPTYIPSQHQLADVLTKLLPTKQHQTLLSKLGVQLAPHSQLEGEC